MDIFGLTPIDTALSVLGLNYAQSIIDFFVRNTPVAAAVFAGGLLFNIWRTIQSGSYRPLAVFLFLVLGIILLLLPNRQEGTIKSAVEAYGQSVQNSQAIKDQITDHHQIPTVLSFIAQSTDALLFGVIHTIDTAASAGAQYLRAPFKIHRSCLYIREGIEDGVGDANLRQNLNKFLHDHYLPAFGMLKHDSPDVDPNELWPGYARIVPYYSDNAKSQWGEIEGKLKRYIDQDPTTSESVRKDIEGLTHASSGAAEQSLIKVIVQNELHKEGISRSSSLIWQASQWVFGIFPYIYGVTNLMLYVLFPFALIALVFNGPLVMLHYLKMYLWVKSWVLCGALSFYSSLLIARLQAQSSMDLSWTWDRPYYCIAAVIVLLLAPIGTLIVINHRGRV